MIGAIEQAIIDRLKAANPVLGYDFREVESLPVDIDESLAERVQQFPSAWTVFGGWKPVRAFGDGTAKVRGTFHVIVAAQNVRNERSTRFGGSSSEVGSYQMAWDVAGLLIDQSLGLAISPLELGGCNSLFTGLTKSKRAVSLFAVELFTEFTVATTAPADLADLDVLHVNWDVPPHGGVDANPGQPGVQLPDDAHADATSHIILNPEA